MYCEVVIMFTDEDKQNICVYLKPVKRMIKEVVMSCLVELCGEEESPECTSSPDGIEQVRKDDMIERAIGIALSNNSNSLRSQMIHLQIVNLMRILH
jgi:hypothetical protein